MQNGSLLVGLGRADSGRTIEEPNRDWTRRCARVIRKIRLGCWGGPAGWLRTEFSVASSVPARAPFRLRAVMARFEK